MNEIGQRLKELRNIKKLTLQEVSNNTGLSIGNISGIENGKYLPSSQALINLSDMYECSVDWILKGVLYSGLQISEIEDHCEHCSKIMNINVTKKMLLNLFDKLTDDNQNKTIDYMETLLTGDNKNIAKIKESTVESKLFFCSQK